MEGARRGKWEDVLFDGRLKGAGIFIHAFTYHDAHGMQTHVLVQKFSFPVYVCVSCKVRDMGSMSVTLTLS